MSNHQFYLILSLLFFIAANGVVSDGAAMIGYVFGILSAGAAVLWSYLERRP
ncbi:hypothetical protein SAMN03159489_05988 [Pseudomonas sp. NFPP07]|uniref:hypothetical protein n=1 Tax=Pseudomonas sp. NFPP07 TaxID=1566213 RepID=UPI0008E66B4C|nr:hypothetical protein [Pseudomonas sp. NFPP07]SFQ82591.1 hypothetical protein SAMN03159489_05988 [Pseudomonas sp. NFPP07]